MVFRSKLRWYSGRCWLSQEMGKRNATGKFLRIGLFIGGCLFGSFLTAILRSPPSRSPGEPAQRQQAVPTNAANTVAGNRGMVLYPKMYENFRSCPVDLHISELLFDVDPSPSRLTIFHFGTGAHHTVGLRNLEHGSPHTVHAITASPGEYARYIELASADGRLGAGYVVTFGDVYNMRSDWLPPLDVASMPHLCEYFDVSKGKEANITTGGGANQDRTRYASHDDRSLLRLVVTEMLKPGGRLLIYSRSHGAAATRGLIGELLDEGLIVFSRSYQTVDVYVKPSAV